MSDPIRSSSLQTSSEYVDNALSASTASFNSAYDLEDEEVLLLQDDAVVERDRVLGARSVKSSSFRSEAKSMSSLFFSFS